MRLPRPAAAESGYALLAVLWVTVGITALVFLVSASARGAVATSRNRIALTVAAWNATACVAQSRVVLLEAMQVEGTAVGDGATKAWDEADRVLRASPPPRDLGCEIDMRAIGSRLDVNAADSGALGRMFRFAGVRTGLADSTVAALVSHRPFVDQREIHRVPGLERMGLLDSLLDVEPGAVSLNHASGPVLATLPGFTERTVAEVLDARARGTPVSGFSALSRLLSPDVPGASARLPGVCVFLPEAWILTVRAHAGVPAVTAVMEIRLTAAAGIGRRRSWIE